MFNVTNGGNIESHPVRHYLKPWIAVRHIALATLRAG